MLVPTASLGLLKPVALRTVPQTSPFWGERRLWTHSEAVRLDRGQAHCRGASLGPGKVGLLEFPPRRRNAPRPWRCSGTGAGGGAGWALARTRARPSPLQAAVPLPWLLPAEHLPPCLRVSEMPRLHCCIFSFALKKFKNLFIWGCTGSLLLHVGFL